MAALEGPGHNGETFSQLLDVLSCKCKRNSPDATFAMYDMTYFEVSVLPLPLSPLNGEKMREWKQTGTRRRSHDQGGRGKDDTSGVPYDDALGASIRSDPAQCSIGGCEYVGRKLEGAAAAFEIV
jgi:hypothetical protein